MRKASFLKNSISPPLFLPFFCLTQLPQAFECRFAHFSEIMSINCLKFALIALNTFRDTRVVIRFDFSYLTQTINPVAVLPEREGVV